MYIAHIREIDSSIQTVQEHLIQVSQLAGRIGSVNGIENLAKLAGLFHDIGKISSHFSQYIKEAHYNKHSPPKRGSVDHSTLGGKYLYEKYGTNTTNILQILTIEIVANAIVSHHGYLQDYLSTKLTTPFLNRLNKEAPEITEAYNEIEEFIFNELITEFELDQLVQRATTEVTQFVQSLAPDKIDSKLMFLTKLLFSILIDADRTNTRQFEENDFFEKIINSKELFSNYYQKLFETISNFKVDENSSVINKLRAEMSEQCDDFSKRPPGIYTLSIPTGGGKTLASFRYALKHAMTFNKTKIFYILPFTTIIEQNAEELRQIIKDPTNILEHHSNVVLEETANEGYDRFSEWVTEDEMDLKSKLQLVQDNWDIPIVFTTLVQFLNVFYAQGTRAIRRLHNLSNSVIIFDECQRIPTHCISLFNEAINFLSENLNCTILLCTATQPALEGVTHGLKLSESHEIVEDLDQVTAHFKRVQIIDKVGDGQMDTEELAHFIVKRSYQVNSQLIILNTKLVVRALYDSLKTKDSLSNVYHLSTSMTPEHRNKVLADIKLALLSNRPVICISTQLIEAGVDISFESVIRSLAGLDSIAQAAGRCNRHGERELGDVFLIDHSNERTMRMEDIETGKSITRKLLSSMRNEKPPYDGDILSEGAMKFYFESFYKEREVVLNHPNKGIPYSQVDLLMSSRAKNKFYQGFKTKFSTVPETVGISSMRTAAKHFYVIDNQTQTLLVPYGRGLEVITEVNSNLSIKELYAAIKNIQQCSIQIYPHELEILKRERGVYSILEGEVYVLEHQFYSKEIGLNLQGDSSLETQMF